MTTAHHPLLRRRDGHHAKVSNAELFFDLVYVFAVTQLSHMLLHNLTLEGAGQTLILWFAVWLGWQYTCWVTNWFDPETPRIRWLLFVTMLLGLVMASALPQAFGARGLVFALAYVAIQVGRTAYIVIELGRDHPLAAKARITPEDLAAETLLIYPVQRQRLDVWRHFLLPAGVSPQLKSVDNTLLLVQMVAARMGIAALPHWVVESFERQGLIVTKTLGEGLWSRLYAAVRDGEQRQPITEAFIRSARNHACDHLPFVRSAERPSGDGPTVKPGSPLPQ